MVERVAAVREAIGPDIDLCIDLHARYDVPSACRIASEMERFDLLWRESRHLGKTLGRVNVRPCELGGEQPSMPREDRHPIPGILTHWHFPATIDTKWREQYRSKIRSSFLEFVVQRN